MTHISLTVDDVATKLLWMRTRSILLGLSVATEAC